MENLLENKALKIFAACGLLSVLTWSAFSVVLDNDIFVIDDAAYVFDNPMVKPGLTLRAAGQAFTSSEQCNWHPLTWISHMLDMSLFGASPRGHHAVNLLFHMVSALLCFFLMHRITRSLPQSFLIALFFAVHPLRVESVAWISERKDVLSVLFALASLICYLEYGAKKSRGFYCLCLLCLLLSLLAKAMFVTLPFVFLLLDYWPLNRLRTFSIRQRQWRPAVSLLIEKIPFFCMILIVSIIAYIAQDQAGATFLGQWYPFHLRCENAAISYIRYIAKIIYPSNLAVFYPVTFSPATAWLSAGSFMLLAAATAIFLKMRRTMPALIVGWLWFLGTLVPVIGLIQIGPQAMADRYTYFPSLGILLIGVTAAARLAAKQRMLKHVMISLAILAASFFFVKTFVQTTYWKNSLTLFAHTLRVTGPNPVIGLLYGEQLEKAKEYEEAFRQYLEVHRQVPAEAAPLVHLSRLSLLQKKVPQAVEFARQACDVSAYKDPAVLKSMAHALYESGKKEESLDYLRRALQLTDRNTQPALYRDLETLQSQLLSETTENTRAQSPNQTGNIVSD